MTGIGLRSGAILGAAFLLLVGCAAGSIYRPATSERGTGYREVQLETNRYRVVFTGAPNTPAATVQDYALLRAAELTLNMGYTWFLVVSRATVEQDDPRPPSTLALGSSRVCGVYGCRGYSDIYGGIILVPDYYDRDRITATLEIRMGKGDMPDDPNAYDAQDVASTIRARITD